MLISAIKSDGAERMGRGRWEGFSVVRALKEEKERMM